MKRDFELVQGDDYQAADNRALVFTGAGQNWPDLSAATFSLKARASGFTKTLFTETGTRSVVGGVQYITVPLSAINTNLLPSGANAAEYDLQATISGRRLTLATGFFSVREAPT